MDGLTWDNFYLTLQSLAYLCEDLEVSIEMLK